MDGTSYAFRCIRRESGEFAAVIFERTTGQIHGDACDWLRALLGSGASPNTVRSYGLRVAAYLSWLSLQNTHWRDVRIATLVQWRNVVAVSKTSRRRQRQPSTVDAWMIATVDFYRWAALEGLVGQECVGDLITDQQSLPRLHGGETMKIRSVRARQLRTRTAKVDTAPKWIEEAVDRRALLTLPLRPRDRFLVELLYVTGLRIGEALSLFRDDLHFLNDNAPHGCPVKGPHIHVQRHNSANGLRAKSLRVVPAPAELSFAYQDYLLERRACLTSDTSENVFVSLTGDSLGQALSYDAAVDLFRRWSRSLGFRVRPHMLRHTRATMWVRGIEGPAIDIDVVRVLLGHRSLSSTLVYTHASQEALRAAVSNVHLGAEESADD